MTDSRSTPRLGALDGLIGYHLRRASAVVAADFTRAVAGLDLRQVPFAVLAVIAENPGVSQGAVGRVLGIQRANMVSLVTDLATRGLLRRVAAERDRRALALRLTEAGEALFAEAVARLQAHEDRLFAGVSPDERGTLLALLGRLDSAA